MSQQCHAKARTTGRQCEKPVTPGATVCAAHGSKAPQVRAAAARRLEHDAARAQLVALGQPVDVDPAAALLGLVHAKAGEVAWLRAKVQEVGEDHGALVWGRTKVKDGGDDVGTTSEARPNVWWALLRTAEDQLADYASRALKAGIEERRVRLAEDQGLLVAGMVRRILDAMFVAMVDALRAAGVSTDGITAALQQAWQQAMTEIVPREIRAIEEGEQP